MMRRSSFINITNSATEPVKACAHRLHEAPASRKTLESARDAIDGSHEGLQSISFARNDLLFTMSDNTRDAILPVKGTRGANLIFTDEPKPIGVTAGGARRNRTDDLLLAKQALSQLSYGPASGTEAKAGNGGPGKI